MDIVCLRIISVNTLNKIYDGDDDDDDDDNGNNNNNNNNDGNNKLSTQWSPSPKSRSGFISKFAASLPHS